jgi:chromosome segregation ATPase
MRRNTNVINQLIVELEKRQAERKGRLLPVAEGAGIEPPKSLADIDALITTIKSLVGEVDALTKQNEVARGYATEFEQKYDLAQGEIAYREREVAHLVAERDALRDEVERLKEYGKFCDDRHLEMAEDLGIVRNKVDTLRHQLEQAQGRVKQLEESQGK